MTSPYDPYKPPTASLEGTASPGMDTSGQIPPGVVEVLAQTRPWVKFLVILFCIGIGLAIVGGMFALSLAKQASPIGGMGLAAMIPVVLVMGLYIPPLVFLWRYVGSIRRLEDGGGAHALVQALTQQKSFWKYLGILTLVMFGLYAVAFVFGGLARLMSP